MLRAIKYGQKLSMKNSESQISRKTGNSIQDQHRAEYVLDKTISN